jgi:hypothetical protein
MKRYYILPLLIALPACSGDDSNPNNGAPGNDASLADSTADDGAAAVEDAGTTPDSGSTPHDSGSADAGPASDASDAAFESDASDAGSESDATDAAPETDASDGGCPTSWYVAPVVDPTITVPDGGGGVLLHAIGSGTQDYKCVASTNDAGTTYTWTLVTPDATLSDCHATVIGHHFASEGGAGFPEWQTTDGTYVVGQKRMGFTPDGGSGSIPWLLVGAVDAGGTGALSSTQFVQRLNTDGGNAPASTCNAGTVGNTTDIPYTADYYFFGP